MPDRGQAVIFKPFVPPLRLFLARDARNQIVPVRNPVILLRYFEEAVFAGVIDHEFALSSAELEVRHFVPDAIPELDRERAYFRGR